MIVVYLIGIAGVGKSTVVTELTRDWTLRLEATKPFAHRHYQTPHGRAVVLGKDTQPFSGTDTLSWTAINHIDDFLRACAHRNVEVVIGEGDRFANDRFLESAQHHADLKLYHLTAPDTTTAERRTKRSTEWQTKPQNQAWIEGRKTKTLRLAERWYATELDATQTPTAIAQQIRNEMGGECP